MAMQVVYSAGTSPLASPRNSPIPPRRYYSPSPRASPRCSPRSSPKASPRGVEGWRPVMPGYKPANSASQTSVVIQRTVEVQHHVSDTDTTLKDSIPAMSRPVAILCLICNILLPGLGTFLSGMTVLCCSSVRPGGGDKWNVIWVNTWVALLQFLTAFLFLLGWIWSIMWGVGFLSIAKETKEAAEKENCEDDENTALAHRTGVTTVASDGTVMRATNGATTHRTTTTTTVSLPEHQNNLDAQSAPIIVLQEAPVIVQPGSLDTLPLDPHETYGRSRGRRRHRTLNPYNPRHQRVLRRLQNRVDVNGLFLSPANLERLVLHSGAPVPDDESATLYDGDNRYPNKL